MTANVDEMVCRGARNIPGVAVTHSDIVNLYEVLKAGKLIMTVDAVKKLEEVYA